MRKAGTAALALVPVLLLAAPAGAQDALCRAYDGAAVIARDGSFLGRIAPATTADSIFDRNGAYGRTYEPGSVWNPHGVHGDAHAPGGTLNPHAPDPPRLIRDGQTIGWLSVDRDRPGAVSPLLLGAVCYSWFP